MPIEQKQSNGQTCWCGKEPAGKSPYVSIPDGPVFAKRDCYEKYKDQHKPDYGRPQTAASA